MPELYDVYALHVAGCPRCVKAGASMVRCAAGRRLRREWIAAERASEHPIHEEEYGHEPGH
jgi:hypothetical protein